MFDPDPFWFKFWLVVFLFLAQGALWAWVGLSSQRLSWWPFRYKSDLIATAQSQQKPNDQ